MQLHPALLVALCIYVISQAETSKFHSPSCAQLYIKIYMNSHLKIFLKKILCIYLKESEWAQVGERGRRRREAASPLSREPSIPGPWDHELSWRQRLNQLSHTGAPKWPPFKPRCAHWRSGSPLEGGTQSTLHMEHQHSVTQLGKSREEAPINHTPLATETPCPIDRSVVQL